MAAPPQWMLAGWRLRLAILGVTYLAPMACVLVGHRRERYSRLAAFARLTWCPRCRRAGTTDTIGAAASAVPLGRLPSQHLGVRGSAGADVLARQRRAVEREG